MRCCNKGFGNVDVPLRISFIERETRAGVLRQLKPTLFMYTRNDRHDPNEITSSEVQGCSGQNDSSPANVNFHFLFCVALSLDQNLIGKSNDVVINELRTVLTQPNPVRGSRSFLRQKIRIEAWTSRRCGRDVSSYS